MSEKRNTVEIHGCIVCGRVFDVLVVYDPEDRMVDCKVISPGGHRLLEEERPFVACDIHTDEDIAKAFVKRQSRMSEELDNEQEDE